jgi:NDP-sugar pyrophosphorylase family protein
VHPTAADFFAPENTEHRTLIEQDVPVWEILNEIPDYLKFRLKPHNHGRMIGNPVIGKEVYIGEGTIIEPGVYVQGPAWIGRNCQIRQGAYIRSNVIVGDECVLGNSSEFKNCLLLNRVQAPHFNYVGDSILGYQAHIGAGVILSNLRSDQQMIKIHWKGSASRPDARKSGPSSAMEWRSDATPYSTRERWPDREPSFIPELFLPVLFSPGRRPPTRIWFGE